VLANLLTQLHCLKLDCSDNFELKECSGDNFIVWQHTASLHTVLCLWPLSTRSWWRSTNHARSQKLLMDKAVFTLRTTSYDVARCHLVPL